MCRNASMNHKVNMPILGTKVNVKFDHSMTTDIIAIIIKADTITRSVTACIYQSVAQNHVYFKNIRWLVCTIQSTILLQCNKNS